MRVTRMLAAVLGGLAAAACSRQNATAPLAPLTEQEIVAAAGALASAGLLGDGIMVAGIELLEPGKAERAAQAAPPRRASARLFDRRSDILTDVVVELAPPRVVSRTARKGAFPQVARRDATEAARLLDRDSTWRAALARRRLRPQDVALVRMGPGVVDEPWVEPGHRYVRLVAYHPDGSHVGAPVEGLIGVVDLTRRAVATVIDAEPAPPPVDRFAPSRTAGRAPRPLRVVGASPNFHITGSTVTWQGWEFQFAMHPREGLVLYDVGFAAGGATPRRVLARASLAEMLVPYGDPSRAWSFRSIFDVGEYGVGREAATLVPGRDLPDNATRLDAVMPDEEGRPVSRAGVTGIYERDGGLRWRHEAEAERAQELVLRFAATVGNYDYGFSWVFSQDGALAMEIDLTGLMLAKGVHQADPRFGTPVTPHLSAVHHQHFFGFRLDFDVDGTENRVREIEAVALPMDGANPHGTAFEMRSTVLGRERGAVRDLAPARSRTWVVENPRRTDSLGGHPGYVLVPGGLPDLLADPAGRLARRGAFAAHALWVTAQKPEERYPAGEFPGQAPGGAGVSAFVADDEPIDGADVVLWYTIGSTHLPRPEEWPVMPVHRMRFELRPTHFLTQPTTAGAAR